MEGNTRPGPDFVYWMPDTEGCGDISPSTWRLPEPDSPAKQTRLDNVIRGIFEVAFKVPGWDEASKGQSPLPFYELPPEAVALMPEQLRACYDAERSVAADPRSGPQLVPYEA